MRIISAPNTQTPRQRPDATDLNSVYNDESNRLRWRHDDQEVMGCQHCYCQWYEDWHISDADWEAGRYGFNVLCRPCFDLFHALELLRLMHAPTDYCACAVCDLFESIFPLHQQKLAKD